MGQKQTGQYELDETIDNNDKADMLAVLHESLTEVPSPHRGVFPFFAGIGTVVRRTSYWKLSGFAGLRRPQLCVMDRAVSLIGKSIEDFWALRGWFQGPVY